MADRGRVGRPCLAHLRRVEVIPRTAAGASRSRLRRSPGELRAVGEPQSVASRFPDEPRPPDESPGVPGGAAPGRAAAAFQEVSRLNREPWTSRSRIPAVPRMSRAAGASPGRPSGDPRTSRLSRTARAAAGLRRTPENRAPRQAAGRPQASPSEVPRERRRSPRQARPALGQMAPGLEGQTQGEHRAGLVQVAAEQAGDARQPVVQRLPVHMQFARRLRLSARVCEIRLKRR